ncbi:hypothetical protein [Flavobacterium branchiophilum]|uniref:Uncharacterized protein n=1 Tax=Flavobacterium branchiophilum TaxID=55197 RepID=A0A2H3KD68_9FLAO|nr:hypothetical protein [Flavobacterium branchiophilum]PDS25517.1 hypothetical protein B0A77_05000 [Flavobacterium branchiophilum]
MSTVFFILLFITFVFWIILLYSKKTIYTNLLQKKGVKLMFFPVGLFCVYLFHYHLFSVSSPAANVPIIGTYQLEAVENLDIASNRIAKYHLTIDADGNFFFNFLPHHTLCHHGRCFFENNKQPSLHFVCATHQLVCETNMKNQTIKINLPAKNQQFSLLYKKIY